MPGCARAPLAGAHSCAFMSFPSGQGGLHPRQLGPNLLKSRPHSRLSRQAAPPERHVSSRRDCGPDERGALHDDRVDDLRMRHRCPCAAAGDHLPAAAHVAMSACITRPNNLASSPAALSRANSVCFFDPAMRPALRGHSATLHTQRLPGLQGWQTDAQGAHQSRMPKDHTSHARLSSPDASISGGMCVTVPAHAHLRGETHSRPSNHTYDATTRQKRRQALRAWNAKAEPAAEHARVPAGRECAP